MNLPTRQQCLAMLRHYHMPRNMLEHTKGVTKVAVTIAKAMKKAGYDVNVELIEGAGLLHDIMKIARISGQGFNSLGFKGKTLKMWAGLRSKYGGMSHSESAYLVLKGKYHEIAEVIRVHQWGAMAHPEKLSWEQKILNYADKRFEEYCTVSMKQRFNGFAARYPAMMATKDIEKINRNHFELEKQIFKNLSIKPEGIKFKSKWQPKKTTMKSLE